MCKDCGCSITDSAHYSNGLLDVIIVELFSHLLDTNLKNEEADSFCWGSCLMRKVSYK